MNKAKICFYDIESTALNAVFGYLLSFGWKFQGDKKVQVISIADYPSFKKDPTNDKHLVKDARKIIMESDVIVGHYSSKFDLPLLNSRLLYHGLDVIPPEIPQVDTWRVARYKMKMHSNRLDALAKFLKVKYAKTAVDGNHWVKAMAGNKASLKYIIEHNKYDILVLEEVYNRLRPLMGSGHPNVNVVSGKTGACPICGERGTLVKRGFNIAKVCRTQRYHCKSCGGWSRGKPERVSQLVVR